MTPHPTCDWLNVHLTRIQLRVEARAQRYLEGGGRTPRGLDDAYLLRQQDRIRAVKQLRSMLRVAALEGQI